MGRCRWSLHGFSPSAVLGCRARRFRSWTYIYLFNPAMAGKAKSALKPLWTVLDRKYWFDEVYQAVFARGGVRSAGACGRAVMQR